MSMVTKLDQIFAPILGGLASVVISLWAQLFEIAALAFTSIAAAGLGLRVRASAWIEPAGNVRIVRASCDGPRRPATSNPG